MFGQRTAKIVPTGVAGPASDWGVAEKQDTDENEVDGADEKSGEGQDEEEEALPC